MSNVGFLLGGALVGVVSLATAAMLNEKSSDSLSPSKINAFDADGLAAQLNSYFSKANFLALKCSNIVIESGKFHHSHIDLPDDDILIRAGNKIGGSMTVVMRKWKMNSLLDLKKEAEQLYAEHRAVFASANALLKQHVAQQVSYKELVFSDKDFSLNNALTNDDWILEFEDLADKIRDALNKSADVAEQLVNGLERFQAAAVDKGTTPAVLSV